jgi:FAD/FMN-containing dehydrogenase
MIVLPKAALKAAVIACSKDTGRMGSMMGVRVLELGGDDRYRLEATDGRMAAIIEGPTGGRGYEDVTSVLSERDYLVSGKELKAALADGNKKVEHCALRCDPDARSVSVSTSPSARCEVERIEGRFPDIASVTKGYKGMLDVVLDAARLKQVCDLALALAPLTNGEIVRIRLLLHYKSGEMPVAFFVGAGEVECQGLLMPLT